MGKARTRHNAAFKAKVALAAVQGQESVAEIARRYKLHANLVYKWKRQLLDNAARAFEAAGGDRRITEREAELLKKIGGLTGERDLFVQRARALPMKLRRAMIERNRRPSIRRQCELLSVSRSSVYYQPVGPDQEELGLMRRIDALHRKHPFFGSRKISQALKDQGAVVNRKRVQRLMRQMGF